MDKEFAPYEEASELKGLGFNEECFKKYYNEDNERLDCPAPLYQQAFRFFRDEYLLFSSVDVDQTLEPKFCYSISRYREDSGWEILVFNSDLYYSHEEAELALLRRLIQEVK